MFFKKSFLAEFRNENKMVIHTSKMTIPISVTQSLDTTSLDQRMLILYVRIDQMMLYCHLTIQLVLKAWNLVSIFLHLKQNTLKFLGRETL